MRSKRCALSSHSYSYNGIGYLLDHLAVWLAQQQGPVQPQRHRGVGQQRVVESSQRKLRPDVVFVVVSELQQHQLASRIQDIGRIERPALRFPAGADLLQEGLLAEEAHPLLD